MEKHATGSLLPFQLQQLLEIIVSRKKMTIEDALAYLYSSKLYADLSSDDSFYWRFSANYLYDELIREKRKQKQHQNSSSPILLFIAFCIEEYKRHKKLDARQVVTLFRQYDVTRFLSEVYETLHTQSRDYIMAEIDGYIRNRCKR